MRYRKKAVLNQAETIALQTYASWTGSWANSDNRKGGFTNKGTYDLYTEAEECKWYECFIERELEEIKKFL